MRSIPPRPRNWPNCASTSRRLDNQFCPGITRDPDTGYIVGFNVKPDNVAGFRTAGLDVSLAYRLRTDHLGTFNVSLVGNYLDRLEFIASPGATLDSDRGEQYIPKYSASFDLNWQKGPVTVAYGISWFAKTDRFTSEDLAGDPDYSDPRFFKVKEKWEHDLQVGVDVDDRFNFYAGVNNLFDAKPAFGYSSYPVSAMGRYYYAGVKVELGPLFK